MIFPYQVIISEAADGDDYVLTLRPEIPVTIIAPGGIDTYLALADTGSDHTIFPKSIADELHIQIRPATGQPATTFGGHQVKLLIGEVTLALDVDGMSCQWKTLVQFYDFATPTDEMIILGHEGFLQFFTATFDGKLATLTLNPNDELPIAE